MNTSTLVLGLGNTLLSDEAVGVEVVRRLEAEGEMPGVVFMDGGTLSFTLAGTIADSPRLIVVDAAAMGARPGTVKVFEAEAMDRQLSGKGKSVHEVSLLDLMDIARITGHMPDNRALIGIQPEFMDWGMQPTQAVYRALPVAVNEAVKLIETWNNEELVQPTESTQFCNITRAESPETGA